MIVFTALLLMGFFASIASFFLKKATNNGFHFRSLVLSPYLYLGGVLYILSALLNLYLLKLLPYSIVVPLGSLTYIWTLLIAHKYLGEMITKRKLFGLVFILLGVFLLTSP